MTEYSRSGLRIVIMGNQGYASLILRNLLAHGEQVVGVCCRIAHRSPISTVWSRAYAFLKRIGMGHMDDFTYQGPFDGLPDPGAIARQHNLVTLSARQLKTAGFESSLRALRPDIILVAGFHRLIPPNIIAVPQAMVNFHPSLLPKHRGGTPNRWVIKNGEHETGVTAHLVSEQFDRGDTIMQRKIGVGEDETWGELEKKIAKTMVQMSYEVLAMVKQGNVRGIPQSHEQATEEPPYHGRHLLIDWSESAWKVRQTCYAIRPKSGGMTTFQGHKLCLWELKVVSSTLTNHAEAGTVLAITGEGEPIVACGSGAIQIQSFLHRGLIRPARTIVKKYTIAEGSRFVI